MDPDFPGDLLGPLEFDPNKFSGVSRVFPLPAPALYPNVVQPLHVFEERYRELTREALDSDGLITMAVLKPGWEPDYASRPPLEPVACLGKILTHHRLEDGRYNLLLAGVSRVRLLEEIEPPVAFRRARVELLEELNPEETGPDLKALTRDLLSAFRQALPGGLPPEPLQRLFEGDAPLGLVADLVAYTLPLPRDTKQAALAEPEVERRARLMLEAIASADFGEGDFEEGGPPDQDDPGPADPDYPGFSPPFSLN